MHICAMHMVDRVHVGVRTVLCVSTDSAMPMATVLQLEHPEIECWTGAHQRYLGLAVLCFLLYCVGIPVLMIVILYRNRNQLHSGRVRARYGSIFRLYK